MESLNSCLVIELQSLIELTLHSPYVNNNILMMYLYILYSLLRQLAAKTIKSKTQDTYIQNVSIKHKTYTNTHKHIGQ